MADTDVKSQYNTLSIQFEKLKQEAIYTLEYKIRNANIPIHMIEGRIKTLDSILGKAKRMDIQSPFEDIHDICGVRVICLFLSDLEKIEGILNDTFEVMKKDDKIQSKQQDQFGYLSIHYMCKFPKSLAGPRYDDLKNLQFEVQVRTIAMHAWATISHYLDYKSPESIPSELKKDFQALSGLFYVADSHFELFMKSSLTVRQEANERIKSGSNLSNEEINFDTLIVFLRQKYPDRIDSDTEPISELAVELANSGYKSLADLNQDLDKSSRAFDYYETSFPPGSEYDPEYNPDEDHRYSGVGVVRTSLSIVNPVYLKMRSEKQKLNQRIIDEFIEARKFL